jgi:hypothetical protein
VLGGEYQKIVYDSVTNSIALTKVSASSTLARSKARTRSKQFQSQSQSQTQSSKKISNSQGEQLLQTIMSNEFFQTDAFYPPDPLGTQDYILMILAVEFEGKTHTTIWTDTSGNVPAGLVSIAKATQEIASK